MRVVLRPPAGETWQAADFQNTKGNSMPAHLVTNNEKREAVREFLLQPEASEMSSRQIARHIGCSHQLVCDMRAELDGRPTCKQKSQLRSERRRKIQLQHILLKLDAVEREFLLSLLNIQPGP